MLQQPQPQGVSRFRGADLKSSDGTKVGTIDSILPNRLTNVAQWLVVSPGLVGSPLIVPVAGCEFAEETVVAAYDEATIRAQPPIELDEALDATAESLLSQHYGLGA